MKLLITVIVIIIVCFLLVLILKRIEKFSGDVSPAFIDLSTHLRNGIREIRRSTSSSSSSSSPSSSSSSPKGESDTKRIVEELTGEEFVKVRPDWLVNEYTGSRLELDMYNERLKLAVEHDGSQHKKFNPRFHKTIEDFQKQVIRDKIKDTLCSQRGITLIRIEDGMKNKREYLKNKIEEYLGKGTD